MKILHKPWWLSPFCGDTWTITIWPNVYPEKEYWENPDAPKWKPVIAHETVHIGQQASPTAFYLFGKLHSWVWEIRYLLSKKFRLEAEAKAYAVELRTAVKGDQDWRYWQAVRELAGPGYRYAAGSEEDAQKAIIGACWDMDFKYVPRPRP
jgi:hypothetical protein